MTRIILPILTDFIGKYKVFYLQLDCSHNIHLYILTYGIFHGGFLLNYKHRLG